MEFLITYQHTTHLLELGQVHGGKVNLSQLVLMEIGVSMPKMELV